MSNHFRYALREPRNRPYYHLRTEFTEDDALRIREAGLTLDLKEAKTGMRSQINNLAVRRARSAFFLPDAHEWIYTKVRDVVSQINETHFGYDLFGIETIQFSEYPATMLGTYDLHRDVFPGTVVRKLSLSIQLSRPEEYEGGDLELPMSVDSTIVADKQLGHGLIFPSYALHRVDAVVAGVRYSLVAWIVGPEFR